MKRLLAALVLGMLVLAAPGSAWAGSIMGASARSFFEDAVASDGYTLQDFEGFSAGTGLTTQIPGLTFESHISTSGTPQGPYPVNVSGQVPGMIVGRPCAPCSDDGRVGYRVIFADPQAGVGVQRNWNDSMVTRFYAPDNSLLYEFSGAGTNYFGYFAESADTSGWVKIVEMDTSVTVGTRQVGYSDDLIYGTTVIPEPSTFGLVAAGVAFLGLMARRRTTA